MKTINDLENLFELKIVINNNTGNAKIVEF